MAWKNGDIPESDLVIFRRGWNSIDGDWFWGLTPGTYARHLALLQRAFDRTGRWLEPSDGWSCYRPYAAQVIARRIWGIGAATPRTSSHGGFWEGIETLAVDYGNWAWVYEKHGGRAAFYEDCRAVGLTPGMIQPDRGYPDEPWHVIDKNPRSGAPAATSNNATRVVTEEEQIMGVKEDILNGVRDIVASEVKKALDARGDYGKYTLLPLADGDHGIWLTNSETGKRTHIANPYEVSLIQRYFNNNGSDQMLTAEYDIVRAYLSRVG
ncbi:hypothetical protein [Microbacterium sp. 5K110]|jgi:hypothetical protein|uniref:hypothetical protein n=1 Tax=Microbacterium sp. 5K110 TaxID=2578104 RepID=UPI0010FD053B|nr:hypothetical protein [Microbacterium sp. 5K110]TLF33222.1 hypothetical protein FE256_03765 [Microbacterium sp. 5K110]